MSLPPETLKRIRAIELRTRKLVNASFSGAYHSVFKGHGVTFDAVRPYQPGDDIRSIDWNVTARTGEAFIKRYDEERELSVLLVLDTSASCLFGTVRRQKRDLAAELGAVIALSAITNNDRVGLLSFSDRIEHYVQPRKGRNHTLRLIRDLLEVQPAGRRTDLSLALKSIRRLMNHRAIVFVMSDFPEPVEDYERDLMIVSKKHDVIAVVLNDPLERVWPNVGLIKLSDAETDETTLLDTASKRWRQAFKQRATQDYADRSARFSRMGIDQINLSVTGDFVAALTRFFQERTRRIRL